MTNAEQVDYNFYETGSIVLCTSGIGCNPMDEYIFLIVREPVPVYYFLIQLEPVPEVKVLIRMRYTYENDKRTKVSTD